MRLCFSATPCLARLFRHSQPRTSADRSRPLHGLRGRVGFEANGSVPLAFFAFSIGETDVVMGWLKHANAAFSVFPSFIKSGVHITSAWAPSCTAMPIDTLNLAPASGSDCPDSLLIIRFAIFVASSTSQRGAKIKNSSPPNRAHRSPARMLSRTALAVSAMTASPVACPRRFDHFEVVDINDSIALLTWCRAKDFPMVSTAPRRLSSPVRLSRIEMS